MPSKQQHAKGEAKAKRENPINIAALSISWNDRIAEMKKQIAEHLNDALSDCPHSLQISW
jgi:hypothetical protein